MDIHDFLFWLVSLNKLSPKRRHMFWELGKNVTNIKRNTIVKQLCRQYNLDSPNLSLIQRLQDLDSITLLDDLYPAALAGISQPPLALFYAGDLDVLKYKNIAIVGSRKPTNYGLKLVKSWVPEFVKAGYVTISGAAKGIDGIVHTTTIDNQGMTIAVLGHGLSFVYPREHRELLNKIIGQGLVLTEYTPWIGPKPWHFPARNRIVVGLTQDVWVVEASEKSGSMVSAQIAEDENRQVWCAPADIDRNQSKGINALIRDGANVALNYNDIISL